jgi:hypothetical protein
MVAILSAVVSIFAFRFRGRASLELELVALRHQVTVLRRQRPGRPQLSSLDRLLWVWLYRFWPQVIDAMMLVKPATVVQWHRKGFRLYWRWRSRRPGRPKIGTEVRALIRRMARPIRCGGRLASMGNCSSWVSRSVRPRLDDGCRGGPRSPPRLGGAFCATTCPTLRRSTCLWSPPPRSGCSIP